MKLAVFFAVAFSGWGQQLDLSSLDKLAPKAKESSIVNLDSDKLKFAGQFLSGNEKHTTTIRDLVSKLRFVTVRNFEFAKPGAFTQGDLEPIRKQLKATGWSKIVDVREEGETSEIYWFTSAQTNAFAVITSEQTELTVVNIVGPIDLKSLGSLSGSLGIPDIHTGFQQGGAPKTPRSKDDDEDDR